MAANRNPLPGEEHQVLQFRPRGSAARRFWPLRPPAETPDAADLAKYEAGGGAEDNYRHRMLVNIAALAFTVMLGIAGTWLAITIADMRKNQDCYLSGRRNCAPIDVHTLQPR